jgi:hypothetical protein
MRATPSLPTATSAVSPVPEYAKPTPELMAQMKMSLDEFYEKRKRGRNAKVFPYERNDGVWFLVRHGDPFKREGAINDDGESVGVYYWPEKFDVVVLDPTEGDLRINTRTQGEIKQYRKVFGRHLYGDDGFFSGASKYTLTPLREKGEDEVAEAEATVQSRTVTVTLNRLLEAPSRHVATYRLLHFA